MIAIWGGVECTINRVHDTFYSQLKKSKHGERADQDLKLIHDLGIRTIRYPILWEMLETDGEIDWSWSDARIQKLQDLQITPIVGLIHHGSGPRHTHLLDPDFSKKFADYARQVAARYPHLRNFTPINEPLTTARFSSLYGFWYPHIRDDLLFTKTFLNQMKASILAMKAIQEIIPDAKLVQTEDLGRASSTSKLAYQAEFENQRRWLTWDLLTGRLNESHSLWSRMKDVGVDQRELEWFGENYFAPALIGINHYLTSNRFLDERTSLYPIRYHGRNSRERYADVEAIRVGADREPAAIHDLIAETWQRYQIPMAITEAHLACTREDQVRWLKEIWDAAALAQDDGIDIRAVTAWSLFGSYDWDSLVTRNRGRYEPGAFDLRTPLKQRRKTAVGRLIEELASTADSSLPVLDSKGWWRRSSRVLYGDKNDQQNLNQKPSPRSIFLVGFERPLGLAFCEAFEKRGIAYQTICLSDLNPEIFRSLVREHRPWAMVNAESFEDVSAAEKQKSECYQSNVELPQILAEASRQYHLKLLCFSSALVFAGDQNKRPYVESDQPHPLSVYGASKLEMEKAVLNILPRSLIIRSPTFFGTLDLHHFTKTILQKSVSREVFQVGIDAVVSPIYISDLILASLDLLIDGEEGIIHLANSKEISYWSLAQLICKKAGISTQFIKPAPMAEIFHSPWPTFSALGSERIHLMPRLENAIVRCLATMNLQNKNPEQCAA